MQRGTTVRSGWLDYFPPLGNDESDIPLLSCVMTLVKHTVLGNSGMCRCADFAGLGPLVLSHTTGAAGYVGVCSGRLLRYS